MRRGSRRTGTDIILLSLLACALPAGAELSAPDPADAPPAGFVDGSAFVKFASADGELVEVNVSGRILQALAGSLGKNSDDPEARGLGEMLSKLHSIRAIVTEIDPARAGDGGEAHRVHRGRPNPQGLGGDRTGPQQDREGARTRAAAGREVRRADGDARGPGRGRQRPAARLCEHRRPIPPVQLEALGGLDVPGLDEAVGKGAAKGTTDQPRDDR